MPPSGALDADQGEGEVEHGKEVAGQLLPADEQSAEAVDPAVGALDWPSTRLLGGIRLAVAGLLATGTDVGIVAAAQDLAAEPEGVVALT